MVDARVSLRRLAILLATASLCSLPARTSSAAEKVTLTGRVVGPDAQPISGAAVLIAAVAPRDGESLLSRYSHADCLKHTFTDEAGAFSIPELSSDVKFTVVVASAGLKRTLLENVIPEQRPLEVTLAPSRLKLVRNPANDVRGRVYLPDGSPAAGAIVIPRGYMQGDTGLEGPMDKVAESTVTDRDGRFTISSTKHITALHLEVAARGAVRQFFMDTPSGNANQDLQLVQGVTARGRVMHDGAPVAGVVVGAIWKEHQSGCWFGPWDTTTDDEGRFVLENLTPDEELCVFGRMKSLGDRGVLAAVPLRGSDEEEIDLGDLELTPGYELYGTLRMEGGAPLPEHTRVVVICEFSWDQIEVPVRPDGRFAFNRLPPELVNLTVRQQPPGAKSPEYKVTITKENLSWNPMRDSQLHGLIDSHRVITIGLKNEAPAMPWFSDGDSQWLHATLEKLSQSPLRGLPGSNGE